MRSLTEDSQSPSFTHLTDNPDWLHQQIIENSPYGILLVNAGQPNRPITNVNPAFERLTGYTAHECIGKDFGLLQGDSGTEAERDTIRRALANGESVTTVRQSRRKDGSLFWNELHISPLRNPSGAITHFACTFNNISARKEAELALAQSEARYQQLFESHNAIVTDTADERSTGLRDQSLFEQSNDAVFIISLQGEYLQVNQRAANLFGYSREELVRLSIYDLIVPEQRRHADTIFQRLLQGEPISPYERIFQHRDGHPIITEINIELVRDVDGSPIHLQSVIRDISDRIHMQNTLRENEQRFRSLIQQSKDGVTLVNENGLVIEWNPGMEAMTGIPKERALGRPVWDCQYELLIEKRRTNEQYEYLKSAMLNVLQTGEADWLNHPVQTTLQQPDGSLLVAQSVMFSIQTATGYRIGSIFRDITERQQMEDALRQSETNYRLLTENVKDVIIKFSLKSIRTYVTPSIYGLLGYRPEELVGGSAVELVHPDDRLASGMALRQALSTRSGTSVIQRLQHKDGHYVWVEATVTAIADPATGAPVEIIAVVRDITERKQIEDALRQSEEKYRLITENTSDGLIIVDGATQHITYASPSYDLQYGREIGETMGRNTESIWEIIHPDDREAVFAQIFAAIERHQPTLIYSYRSQHKQGHYFWREDHARFHYTPDGSLLNANVVSRDITERKRMEERQIELMLERERTGMLSRFIRDAAHEFRTPLSIIGSSTYLLSRSSNREQRERRIFQIETQIKRITRLVDMLLILVKLESDDPIMPVPVDISAILQTACRNAVETYGTAPVITCHVPAALPAVSGDSNFLADAFQQILDNACRFTPPTGSVTVMAGTSVEHLWVEVADTGLGIPENNLPHIFKTFWRHDHEHTTSGLGLGLPITNRIIQSHGGQLDIESRLNHGTRLRITLPITNQIP